jgi:hypothetical protein
MTGIPYEQAKCDEAKQKIIGSKDVLALFADKLSNVIAGEAVNAKLLYLSATSRLFDNTMHVAIKGTSSGGKSILRTEVLKFFPPEDVISFTTLSEKALLYYDDDFAHKVLSMGEAAGAEEQSLQDYLLRELISEKRLRYPVVQKLKGGLTTTIIEKNGPVAFMVTTTKNALHPENETRLLSLEINDTEAQTREVLTKVAEVEGLGGASGKIDYAPWNSFQRWLAEGPWDVDVPFARELADSIPAVSVRLRRDFGQVLRAIKAHALIHRANRARDADGRIVATLTDYAAVRELINGIISASSGIAVKSTVRETVEAVKAKTVTMPEGEGITALDVAKHLKLDKSAAWRRLKSATLEGLIVNIETRRGQPGRYRFSGQEIEEADILPDVSILRKSMQPCNRTPKAESKQDDNGCKPPCNRSATDAHPKQPVDAGCKPVADPLATAKSMSGKMKSPPVARLHEFSGGIGEGGSAGSPPPPSEEADLEFEERAAILEYEGGYSREEAERRAWGEILARDGIIWEEVWLREAG